MDKIGFAIITKEQDFLNHNLNQKEYHHIINNWSPPGKGLHLYPEIPVLSSLKIEQLKRIGFSFVVSNNERDTHGRIGGQRGVILVMNEDSFDSLFNQNIQSLFGIVLK